MMKQKTMMKDEDGTLTMKTMDVEKDVCSELLRMKTQNVQKVVSGDNNGGASFDGRLGGMKDKLPDNPATNTDRTQD